MASLAWHTLGAPNPARCALLARSGRNTTVFRSILRMRRRVSAKHVQPREAFSAFHALKGLLARVASNMARQVFLARKDALADVAFDG